MKRNVARKVNEKMASLSTDKNGYHTIQFTDTNKKRKSVRLPKKTTKKAAETTRLKIEHLLAAKMLDTATDLETTRWVAGLGKTVHDKLSTVGLISPRASTTLASFIDGYIADRSDIKPATATFYGHTRRNLVEFFGADKRLQDIKSGDADRWRLGLISQGLSDNTVRRRCSLAKQFFRSALRDKLIQDNPFVDLKSCVLANRKRDYFVTCEEAEKVLDSCPDAQWRLIFALSRYGGLRCPSEHLALRWGDIDWERGRMVVTSPKTEHHPN